MEKQEIYEYLENKEIWYEVTKHKAVYNMKELSQIPIPYPEADAKNLFVRDDKKRTYYLITIKGDKKVDLKQLRKEQNTRPLSFASNNDLKEILKLEPGSVSPFGILNDETKKVKFFLDQELTKNQGIIGVHPNDNTETVWLKTMDLIQIIKEHGNETTLLAIKEGVE